MKELGHFVSAGTLSHFLTLRSWDLGHGKLGKTWGTNVGQDWGQDIGTRLGTGLGTGLGTDHGTRLGTGQGPTGTWDKKNNFGTKFFNFLLFGPSLRDYNLSLPARSRSSGAKNEGVMPFFFVRGLPMRKSQDLHKFLAGILARPSCPLGPTWT